LIASTSELDESLIAVKDGETSPQNEALLCATFETTSESIMPYGYESIAEDNLAGVDQTSTL